MRVLNNNYGTHIHPLTVAVLRTSGAVVELGMGDYSTPVLHEICKLQGRLMLSYEKDLTWLENFIDLESDSHKIRHNETWDEYPIDCGVVFVDQSPAEYRQKSIEKYRNFAKIIVVHDTEKKNFYGYDFSGFKYKYEYKRYRKETTLLSNHIDVSELF